MKHKKIINVKTKNISYKIFIGENLLESSGVIIKKIVQKKRVIIITDKNVAKLHLKKLIRSLKRQKILVKYIVLPAGEKTKNVFYLNKLLEEIIKLGVDRKDTLIALGGGVVGDITGLAASILLRGINYIQIPTSLLAQVDSSVGGKTGINSKNAKNLIGTFLQPKAVIIDVLTLKTLSKRQLKCGYAEIVKYSLIDDKRFFTWLEKNGKKIIEGNSGMQVEAIKRSCLKKAKIVQLDEKEHGIRSLLNLGHTFGHALESVSQYSSSLLHGEAVSIGIILAFKFSQKKKLLKEKTTKTVENHFMKIGLPTKIKDIKSRPISTSKILNHMLRDKKIENKKLTLILSKGIGNCFIVKNNSIVEIRKFLANQI